VVFIDELHGVVTELLVVVIAPELLLEICPVDIMRAAYCVLLCMVDQVLNTAAVAIKPKIINMSGTEAMANSTATEPRSQFARALPRPLAGGHVSGRGHGGSEARSAVPAKAPESRSGADCLIIYLTHYLPPCL
jgi:hypothetical protein